MKEDKDQQRKISTCLEGSPWAEMMQRIMDEQGADSPCEKMMSSLMTTGLHDRENPQKAKKEEVDGREE